MIKIKRNDQLELFGLEKWRGELSDRKLKLLRNSWAEQFRRFVLPSIPVEKIAMMYSKKMGRPTKELNSIVGAVILQEFFDLTDVETVDNMAFNQNWHYALDCFDDSDQVISLKTLWTMRKQISESGLYNEIFSIATDEIISKLGIDVSKQRLDSVHVHSNMARLGRIRIQVRTLKTFLKNLKKRHPDLFNDKIDQSIKDNYLQKDSDSLFSRIKPSDRERSLQAIGEDVFSIICLFDSNTKISRMKTYRMLKQVFYEHFDVDNNSVNAKKSKDVSSDSIQNPSDPDAGYDGHKGQGYHTQIMETYREEEDRVPGKNDGIDIITHVDTEPANEHDSNAVIPAIEDMEEREHKCDKLLADAAYGGTDKIEKSKAKGVDLVSPTLGRNSEKEHESFEFDPDTYEVTSCPAGKKPDEIRHNKKNSITAIWYEETCENCEFEANCPAKDRKRGKGFKAHYYTINSAKCHLRRMYEDSQAFRDIYRFRSGIEATISRFISMTGARRSRYRGLKKMRFSQKLKALGINVLRVTRYMSKSGCFSNILNILAKYFLMFDFLKPKNAFYCSKNLTTQFS